MVYCSVDLFSSAIVSAIYRRRVIAVTVCWLKPIERLHLLLHAALLSPNEAHLRYPRCFTFRHRALSPSLSLLSGSFNPHSRPAV